MNTENINIESLCASEDFQNYCLNPTPQSTQYWNQWLVDNKEHTPIFEASKNIILQLSLQVSEKEIEEELSALKLKLPTEKKAPINNSIRTFLKIAASFLLLLSIFGVWKINSTPIPSQSYTTQYGQTQTIALPDGTNVVLNANSTLTYKEDWTSQREVHLDGEAFFEVEHNKDLPFIVHTEKGDVNVLGTVFNVMQRSKKFDVTLVQGKVQLVLENKRKVDMNPGEQVSVLDNKVEKNTVDTEAITSWHIGKMIFKNATIKSIIERLEDDYGWNINVKDTNLLKRKVNASIQKNNPKLLLDALKEIYELDIKKISEGVYEIK